MTEPIALKNTAPHNQRAVPSKRNEKAEVVEVIVVKTTAGSGTEEDPYRFVSEFWSKDGKLLAIADPLTTAPWQQSFPD